MPIRLLLSLTFIFSGASVASAQPWPVKRGTDGKLAYTANEQGDRVPDFSSCGYRGSDHPIPNIAASIVVRPSDDDDTARLQAALDYVGGMAVEKLSAARVVQLTPGEYHVSGSLRVAHSNVVLRGAGADATTLIATGTGRRPLIRIEPAATPQTTTSGKIAIGERVPVGATRLPLAAGHVLQRGDRVLVTRPSTDEWIKQLGAKAFGVGWRAGRCDIHWERVVAAADDASVTLDAPITTALEPNLGGGTVARLKVDGRLENVGVEHLALRSECDRENPKDEAHSWHGVVANHARDAWVRGVRFEHFAGGAVLLLEGTSRVTVEDCLSLAPVSELGGYRRQAFFTQGGQCLFLRCYSEEGLHDFALGHCAPGPNAFVNCYAERSLGDSGPLESWASGVLFDNVRIEGGELCLMNRWLHPPGAGWSAANCLAWNCQAGVIRAFQPPGAQNWVVCFWAQPIGDALFTGDGDFAKPISLYRQQLVDRRGKSAGELAGPFLLDPIASTNPTLPEAERFVASSNQPARVLRDLIEERLASHTAKFEPPTDLPDWQPPAQRLPPGGLPTNGARPITRQNGWLTINDRVLTGGHVSPTWWRGTIRPHDAPQFGPSITRWAPGRYGVGLTDQLPQTVDRFQTLGVASYDHHYGLWYDRRRDDHLMVRRPNGTDAAPPFFEQPFARSGRGQAWDGLSRYDLTKFNAWYWERMQDFADLCDQHGLAFFHQHYFQHNIIEAGAHWADSPWRPVNNVNQLDLPEPPPYIGDKRIFLAHKFYDMADAKLAGLQAGYVRHCLDATAQNSNVIHSISAEYTGPLAFTQAWLDTIRTWQEENPAADPLVALACTKAEQDELLADEAARDLIDLIDIRYWCYARDGELYAPLGGVSLSPRQQLRRSKLPAADFHSIARAVREYRLRYPGKAVSYFAEMYCNSPREGWAVLMGGGSLAAVPPLPDGLAAALVDMKPEAVDDDASALTLAADSGERLVYFVERGSAEFSLPACRLSWIDPRTGAFVEEVKLGAGDHTLEAKSAVLWVRPLAN
ncbi:hypothetical protein Pla123a_08080 [Posidoniimonas polymericola]|uniref:DUF6298 domain-containing protein n=1 Tax=Posidoniimonas polymericola TaxID=2528002 RepID=A0A5C5ZFW4_9BACT|nr:DUF6298 domain-containing protein [Posidoniimonas polymericola]TWT86000.1 hypothetical protein Pla123a_08080 [Posidoniimonas polymericola]